LNIKQRLSSTSVSEAFFVIVFLKKLFGLILKDINDIETLIHRTLKVLDSLA
jgi:hypothetical protein